MSIAFSKLTGSGNDFILIDNLAGRVNVYSFRENIPKVCLRALSIGADGVIFVEPSTLAHFRWRFFNADGSEAEMCGNGGRCVARFAFEMGIAPWDMAFETLAGVVKARVLEEGVVRVQFPSPHGWRWGDKLRLDDGYVEYSFVNTGVPHVVIMVDDLEGVAVKEMGRKIRFHPLFSPAGTNVNFVQELGKGRLAIRTYERGVEDETLACGTGATASALIYLGSREEGQVEVVTRSGETLGVEKKGKEVYLQGATRWIYDGRMRPESWQW
jgi:diaminopimelate epimerase